MTIEITLSKEEVREAILTHIRKTHPVGDEAEILFREGPEYWQAETKDMEVVFRWTP